MNCFLVLGWALGTLSYQFFLLVNADVLVSRFIILTEGQVPFLAVSITPLLVLISEIAAETARNSVYYLEEWLYQCSGNLLGF